MFTPSGTFIPLLFSKRVAWYFASSLLLWSKRVAWYFASSLLLGAVLPWHPLGILLEPNYSIVADHDATLSIQYKLGIILWIYATIVQPPGRLSESTDTLKLDCANTYASDYGYSGTHTTALGISFFTPFTIPPIDISFPFLLLFSSISPCWEPEWP